jgi:hypothetical protein
MAAIAAWLVVVLSGLGGMLKYKSTPTEAGVAPAQWPTASRLVARAGLPTLILFAHPHCPCTRASLEELNQLLQPLAGSVTAYVAFTRPAGIGGDWTHSELWSRATTIPGVRVTEDVNGEEAQRFGAASSGHVVAYDAGGRLIYSGGITGARGHVDDNLGRARLTARLDGKPSDSDRAPVFGCALNDEKTRGRQ